MANPRFTAVGTAALFIPYTVMDQRTSVMVPEADEPPARIS